jgi:predicted enzyme related to lactoylglutathione lyase
MIFSGRALAIALAIVTCPDGSASASPVGVGPQYDTSHVYVAPQDLDRFVDSFIATFGGSASKEATLTVTPSPSSTKWRAAITPVGTLSVFGFTTPVPYPFGSERTGYLVTDMDNAIAAAKANGASVVVAPFRDPIGRDAVIQWPGGVNMQLYWHNVAPHYAPLKSIPENRVYLPADRAGAFIHDFLGFSQGQVVEDVAAAPGTEISKPSDTYRRVRLVSVFGRMTVIVTDGHLPYPYGLETIGYEVDDLDATLAKAKSAGAAVLAGPYETPDRRAAMVRFPGGYIAEIHAPKKS